MKKVGYVLVTLGFLAGAFFSVLETLVWQNFIISLAVAVIGVVMIRVSDRLKKEEGTLNVNLQLLATSLDNIVGHAASLCEGKETMNTYDVHRHIDKLFPDDINNFVEARESIAHVHGLQAYADVMSYFAAGERYLNRVWSASADGYVDEVNAYLEHTRNQFLQAQKAFNAITGT